MTGTKHRSRTSSQALFHRTTTPRSRLLGWVAGSLVVSMVGLSGCSFPMTSISSEPTYAPTSESTSTPMPTSTPTAEPLPTLSPTPYHPGGPDMIRLYEHRKLVRDEFRTRWIKGTDIGVFYAYPVEKESVETLPYMDLLKKYWVIFPQADRYKIGYNVQIRLLSGEIIDKTIRLPKDSPKDPNAYFYQFIEIYVYDNLNRIPGPTFYHLEESSTYANTIMTSIKLTAGTRSDEVDSIVLTAFVFDGGDDGDGDEEFDPTTGKYIGQTYWTIDVVPEA
jgi:hypothetical protein